MDWNSFDFERAVNAFLLLVGGVLSLLGISRVKNAAAPAEDARETVEIAGAIIDRKDVDRLVKAFDDMIVSTNGLTALLIQHRRAIEQSTEGAEELRETVKDVARDLRDATHEMVRRPR